MSDYEQLDDNNSDDLSEIPNQAELDKKRKQRLLIKNL